MKAILVEFCLIVAIVARENVCKCSKFYERAFDEVDQDRSTCNCLAAIDSQFKSENRADGILSQEERTRETLKLEATLKEASCRLEEDDQDKAYKILNNRENIEEMNKLECYGGGDLTHNLGSLECNCNTKIDISKDTNDPDYELPITTGSFCKECRDGYINWPDCDTIACKDDACGKENECDDKRFKTEFCSFFDYDEIKLYGENGNYGFPRNLPRTVNPSEKCCSGGTSYDYRLGKVLTGFTYKLSKEFVELGHHCCNNGDTGYCNANQDCIGDSIIKTCVNKKTFDLLDQCVYNGNADSGTADYHGPEEKKIVICQNPGQTCCGSQCCNPNQICREKTNGLARYDWVNPSDPTKVVHDDDRMECSTDIFSGPAIIRFAVFPALLIIALLVSTALVIGNSGMGEIKVAGPALIVIVCSIFLVVSQYWAAGLLLSLGSLLAIGAQAAKSEYRHVFSLIVQFLFFAAFVGNFGVSNEIIATPSYSLERVNQLQNSYSEDWTVLGLCSSYYGGTFNQQGSPTQPWDQSHIKYYGLCAYHYQSFLLFMLCLAAAFYFIQLVASATLTANK